MPMDYTTLTGAKTVEGSIRNYTNWAETPADTVLTEAQAYIFSRLRVREMEHVVRNLTIAEDAETLELPPDFIAPMGQDCFGIQSPWQCSIDIFDAAQFETYRATDDTGAVYAGQPRACMILGQPAVAHFDVKADQAYSAKLLYYRRPAALADDNPTNWLTDRYPQLLRHATNYFAWLHKREPAQASASEKLVGHFIDVANGEADMERQSRRVENYWRS
ncbi:MAG: hypothetical protein AB7O44_30335 [Hyphomicrobiaceae bacterium]